MKGGMVSEKERAARPEVKEKILKDGLYSMEKLRFSCCRSRKS